MARERFVRWGAFAAVVLLMLVHGSLAIDVELRKSVTLDEAVHLPAGLSYLEKGTFRMLPLNGPVGRLIPALLARHVPHHTAGLYESAAWRAEPPLFWHFGLLFQELNTRTPEDASRYLDLYSFGRLGTVLVSMGVIPILYLWGRWWFGELAGLLSALLFALCPTVIAHAGLTTTDLATTATGLLCAFTFAHLLAAPGPGLAILAGLTLGIAQVTKFSALWLLVVLLAWGGYALWRRRPRAGRAALLGVVLAGATLFAICATYAFEGVGDRLDSFRFTSRALTREVSLPERPATRVNRFAGTFLGRLPVPLPRYYVVGFDALKFEDESRYQMYLDGVLRHAPWRRYYVEALLLKLPLGTLVLVAIGSGTLLLRRSLRPHAIPIALLTMVPLLIISFLTSTNLGIRYVLPLFPILFLAAGATLARAAGPTAPRALLAAACLLMNVGAIARIHPNELAFFNVIGGGPARGRFHLIDSNLDWGQDLRPLAAWLDRHPDWKRDVRLAYAGMVAPEIEGVSPYRLAPRDLRYVPPVRHLPWERKEDPSSWGPQPGKFAVSVNFERGMFLGSPCPRDVAGAARRLTPAAFYPDTSLLWSPGGAYAYFQELQPRIEPEIGYSILLYDVSREEAQSVRKRLGIPPLPDPETFREDGRNESGSRAGDV